MNELYHHGIKDQKWSVRRFQNYDGSRIKTGDFVVAEANVKKEASNLYSRFKKEPINLNSVKDRSGLGDEDAQKCVALANRKFEQYAKVEPRITNDVVSSISDSGGTMYGLKYRLKQPTSLAGKIGKDAIDDGVTFDQAARNIKDTLRYTSITDEKNFVKAYNSTVSKLRMKGYYEIRCKNYFQLYLEGKAKHKSVQSVFTDREGNMFELQFQTAKSQAAKELKVPIYEERRKSGISSKKAYGLEQQMDELANKVPTPVNVLSIKNK